MEISVLARFSGALHIIFGGAPCVLVRRSRLLPVPQSRENMRRHVLRVGDGSSHLSVSSCCLETIHGMFWIVVCVNQVVQGTRVLRFLCVHFLKKPGRDRLSLESWCTFFDRAENRKPIEKLELVIWILFVERFHCIFVCLITLRFRSSTRIFVQGSNGIEVHLLARRFSGCLHPLL